MLDIKVFRESSELIKKSEKQRSHDLGAVEDVIKFDKKWREATLQLDKLKHRRNVVSEEINKLKKAKKSAATQIKMMKKVVADIKYKEKMASEFLENREVARAQVGNILHKSVPKGKDESDNKVVKIVGKKPRFGFEPKDHLTLLRDLNLIDTEKGAEVAGANWYYLKNELVLLDYAIMQYAIKFLVKKGYTLIEPPYVLKRKPYSSVTSLDDFENVMYKVEDEDLYLIATSEHPIAALLQGENILENKLPLKLAGVSPCFRREVGSHGKYEHGLFRMHQFNKIEMFIFCKPEDSWRHHEELQRNAEALYSGLGLPFRVVNVCTGDLGPIAAKKYDIECLTADGTYREAGSNSNCTAYQASSLGIKYVDKKSEKYYLHTLNSTALATSRTMLFLLEHYQQKDGSIKIPRALWKYTGFKKIKAKK